MLDMKFTNERILGYTFPLVHIAPQFRPISPIYNTKASAANEKRNSTETEKPLRTSFGYQSSHSCQALIYILHHPGGSRKVLEKSYKNFTIPFLPCAWKENAAKKKSESSKRPTHCPQRTFWTKKKEKYVYIKLTRLMHIYRLCVCVALDDTSRARAGEASFCESLGGSEKKVIKH